MKVLLEAPILTQSGYGEHSRLVFRALQKEGVEVYTNPLSWGRTSWITKFDRERERIEKSINNFYSPREFVKILEKNSFEVEKYESFNFGLVTIYKAKKL